MYDFHSQVSVKSEKLHTPFASEKDQRIFLPIKFVIGIEHGQ
jgi:hypothetical protein